MNPAPIYDTSDLDAIAALDDVEIGEAPRYQPDVDNATWNAAQQRWRWATWVRDAKLLATAGVQPGPSHIRYVNRQTGEEHVTGSVWGAFFDADELTRPGLPLVMFAAEVTPNNIELPHIPHGYPWKAVAAQTAGMACHHRYLVGLVLEPKPEKLADVIELSRFCDIDGHDCIGLGQLTLSELATYHRTLERLELRAEHSWHGLEEAIYPLDAGCAAQISDTALPTDDELHPPPEPNDRKAGWAHLRSLGKSPWTVYIIGENCD